MVSAVGFREERFAAARFRLLALEPAFEAVDAPVALCPADLEGVFFAGELFFVEELFGEVFRGGVWEEAWASGAIVCAPAQDEPASREPRITAA
jgi:hypothetical protein